MKFELYFNWAAFLIYLVIYINMKFKKGIRTKRSDMFQLLLLCSFISVSLDLCVTQAINGVIKAPLSLNYAGNILYLISFNAIPVIFLRYVLTLSGMASRMSPIKIVLLYTPFLLSVS